MCDLDFFVDESLFGMSQAIQSSLTLGKNFGSLVWLPIEQPKWTYAEPIPINEGKNFKSNYQSKRLVPNFEFSHSLYIQISCEEVVSVVLESFLGNFKSIVRTICLRQRFVQLNW